MHGLYKLGMILFFSAVLLLNGCRTQPENAAENIDTKSVSVAALPEATPVPKADGICVEGNLECMIYGDELEVIGYAGDEAELVIPEVTNGKRIVAIRDNAFSARDEYLQSITIPGSIADIPPRMLSKENGWLSGNAPDQSGPLSSEISIHSVVLKDGVRTVGTQAFCDCPALQTVVIPDSVKRIGAGAFTGTAWHAALPQGFTVLGDNAIHIYAGSEEEVFVPDGAKRIDFFRNENVQIVYLPDGMECINDYAFYACTGLLALIVPDSVTEFEENAFAGCEGQAFICENGSAAAAYAKENWIGVYETLDEMYEAREKIESYTK